jgi:hypothetical protein
MIILRLFNLINDILNFYFQPDKCYDIPIDFLTL